MKYLTEKDFLVDIFQKAFQMFYNEDSLKPSHKTEYDIVTAIDIGIEDYIISEIKQHYPNDLIYSEERNAFQKIGDRTWVIDPIDGTVNMSHGIKLFGIQGALIDSEETVMSVIYLPCSNEIYFALKSGGAYCNNIKISVCKRALNQSVVSFSDYPHNFPEQSELQHKLIKNIYPKIAKIRMYGAACIDFTYIASGKIDATVCGTGYLWDIAPGMLLCKEAGAEVINISGKPFSENDFFAVAVATDDLKYLIFECAR